jgi:hypothetical protein
VLRLTTDEVSMLKLASVDDDNVKVPAELEKLKTDKLMRIAQAINSVATDISHLDTFKAIIADVIGFIYSGKAPTPKSLEKEVPKAQS